MRYRLLYGTECLTGARPGSDRRAVRTVRRPRQASRRGCLALESLADAAAELVVGNIECAAAAFARVARQITGCTPTTSYIDELPDERTAVMERELVMVCSGKGPAIPP